MVKFICHLIKTPGLGVVKVHCINILWPRNNPCFVVTIYLCFYALNCRYVLESLLGSNHLNNVSGIRVRIEAESAVGSTSRLLLKVFLCSEVL